MARKYATKNQLDEARNLARVTTWPPAKIASVTGVAASTCDRYVREERGYKHGPRPEKEHVATVTVKETETETVITPESEECGTRRNFTFSIGSKSSTIKDMVDEITKTIEAAGKLGLCEVKYNLVIQEAEK